MNLNLKKTAEDPDEIYKIFVEVLAWRDTPDEAGALSQFLIKDFHYTEVASIVDRFGGAAEPLLGDDKSAWTHYVFHYFDDASAAFERIMGLFRSWEMTGEINLQVWHHTIGPDAYMYVSDPLGEEVQYLVGEPFEPSEERANPRASYYPDIDLEMFDELES